jgi:hypothetical protein
MEGVLVGSASFDWQVVLFVTGLNTSGPVVTVVYFV